MWLGSCLCDLRRKAAWNLLKAFLREWGKSFSSLLTFHTGWKINVVAETVPVSSDYVVIC